MTRRAPFFLIPTVALLPLLWVASCQPPAPPPTQAISSSASGKDVVVEPPSADEKKVALERIDAAIKAHGGAEKLRKLNRHVQHLKGMLRTEAFGIIQADHDITVDLPDRLSLVVKAPTRQGPQHIILAIDHGKSWMSVNGNVENLPQSVHVSVKEELYYRGVMTLTPLMGADYVIKPIEAEPISGRPVTAVRVGAKDHRTVDLSFDKETHLLVRTFHPAWDEADRFQRREVLFAEHKEFEGVKLPTVLIDKRDNERWVDCTAEYKFVEKFDAKEFARPQ